ncbi:ubiquitin-like protein [Ascodesmis nigricans]|uniref:Ubiquitin-like protein n=1 Tax=Ascodesmis nigricans TaxID=341454 RepID=A0A4S2N3G3_9PEZI|nr:ubiquitin-like protein [Ascodesmis nigricans]
MADNEGSVPPPKPEVGEPGAEHLNIKVTDNNNEVFFKIKRSTQLKKLMDAFCERQGKSTSSVRFLFDGTRVQPGDTPDSLDMQDGDTLEVHQEQIGGC